MKSKLSQTTGDVLEISSQVGARPEDVARYIAEMTGQLAALAGAQRMPMLTYFLNMARVEAEMQAIEAAAPMARKA